MKAAPCTTPTADFVEWRALALLRRHPFGCTKFEAGRFLGLPPAVAGAVLERLRAAGAVESAPYVRGAVFSLIA